MTVFEHCRKRATSIYHELHSIQCFIGLYVFDVLESGRRILSVTYNGFDIDLTVKLPLSNFNFARHKAVFVNIIGWLVFPFTVACCNFLSLHLSQQMRCLLISESEAQQCVHAHPRGTCDY